MIGELSIAGFTVGRFWLLLSLLGELVAKVDESTVRIGGSGTVGLLGVLAENLWSKTEN